MEFTVGTVLEGKVKSITNFGAFIALPENRTGLVHISEVANAFVSDIRQFLTEGQDVKVLVIGNENGKINLSIKRLEPRPQPRGDFRGAPRCEGGQSFNGSPRRNDSPRPEGEQRNFNSGAPRREEGQGYAQRRNDSPRNNNYARAPQQAQPKTNDQIFEEKLKAFMNESDSKISSSKLYQDHRTRSRKR